MAPQAQALLEQFVQLPDHQQVEFLQALADQPTAEENAELNRRIQAVRSGDAVATSWDVVRAELLEMLAKRRNSAS